jgi:serine/threonine-protein kinase
MTSESRSDPRPDPLLGQTLVDRYRLTRKIGEGGMGAVYEALHVTLGKPVAVKVLREKYLDHRNLAERLVREARLASAIRNQHIVDITDSGMTADGRTFVVMELLEGMSLAELLRREGALPEARAIRIVQQVADALGAAHKQGIVHRDVKPENVFLVAGDGDFVKVVDFGISVTVQATREEHTSSSSAQPVKISSAQPIESRLTSTGMVLGTPFYMSPEQARGDENIDQLIDIYALGVILYECLTGEVPFRGGNYLGIISRVLNQEAVRPRALRPELRISEPIERVTLRAMAKAREERYPTMEAFGADLERALNGEWVQAPVPDSSTVAKPEGATGSRTWLFAALAMALLGGGALLWAGRTGRAPAPPTVKPAPVVAPAPAPPPPAPAPTVVVRVETDPPGAEVRQGSRVFGLSPRPIMLPRSSTPVHLGFVLDGYEPGSADVVPLVDDTLHVKLTPRPKTSKKKPSPTVTQPTSPPRKPEDGETKPNPY